MTIIGLDISTSCTGWAVLDSNGELVDLGHIDFKGCSNLWEKVDRAERELVRIVGVHVPSAFFVEESLQGFRPGLSSAATLLTLAKFNGILSYRLRELIQADPQYISSGDARRSCGVKLVQLKKHPRGLGHKQQTFNAVTSAYLSNRTWPEKKRRDGAVDENASPAERVVDWAMDEVDAYVVARAGWLRVNKAAV